jgi:hypothetical protein
MVVNNAEDNHNLHTRNNLFGGEITIYEIVYLFWGRVGKGDIQ